MSTITTGTHSRASKMDAEATNFKSPTRNERYSTSQNITQPVEATKPEPPQVRLEGRLQIKDLETLQGAFMEEGDGYDNRLSLNKEQFIEALSLILNKGTKHEYSELFDKIDVTKEGLVDWDKFASHMLLEFYERDDRVKSTQVPQWKDLKQLQSPHKEIIIKMAYLKNTNRYMAISREGVVSMWGQNLKLQRSLKTGTDSCRSRDLWVTHFVFLQNINKIALSFTSKEIAIYDLSTKLEFNCQYKVQGLEHTPLCLDYWSDPQNSNEAILVWGDTGGCVNSLYFNSASIALFERPSAPAGEKQAWQEPCLNVHLREISKKKYKNATYMKHQGHKEWIRQVCYSHHLECFISCSTTWASSLVIGWMEKHAGVDQKMKTTTFQISQGVNAFDFHEQLNLIATAGVNHHVCLWNPYVVSKPNGVLRGHMASVVQVQFNKTRGQLISFSKDKVLRIWDVQLQVCIQRLAGMFPKGHEVISNLFFDEARNKLFLTFNYQLTVLEMKAEIRDRIMSHEKPVIGVFYNQAYNQVVSMSQDGTLTIWMLDTGQKVKQFSNTHGNAEVTSLGQDQSRILTGSTDGTIKIWDFNGHCYHQLQVTEEGQPADVGQVLALKRSILAVGWAKYIAVFRSQTFKDYHILPADWKGGQEHNDDILALSFSPPNIIASGSYDGEIIIWNNNSEQASRRLQARSRKTMYRGKSTAPSREASVVGSSESRASSSDHRSRSRARSRLSELSADDATEYGYAITKLAFLNHRKTLGQTEGANLVSCGGNGWVRFWNTTQSELMGEFMAHIQVSSIIMAIDKEENNWLATGDTDGLVKVWDIREYCINPNEQEIIKELPRLQVQFQAHTDIITAMEMTIRNDRMLVLSASLDCAVSLWDVYGNHLGIFGQEQHWKIEPYLPDEENLKESSMEESDAEDDDEELESETCWIPDERATEDPNNFRINVWDSSVLGKDYQELRVQKRERKQPHRIPDLPYLHWEKTGQPPAGPYAALETATLADVRNPSKPDFVMHPHRYFNESAFSDNEFAMQRLPALAERLNTAFDEKLLFPRYILEFEAKMKQYHNQMIKDHTGMLTKKNSRSNLQPQLPPPVSIRSVTSPKRGGVFQPVKPHKLKPIKLGSGKDKE